MQQNENCRVSYSRRRVFAKHKESDCSVLSGHEIYIDLNASTAYITARPTDLDTSADKGLRASERCLYDPSNTLLESPEMQQSPFTKNKNKVQPSVFQAPPLEIAHPRRSKGQEECALEIATEFQQELNIKFANEILQRMNLKTFVIATPVHIREPIDLSGLPSVEQRTHSCRLHSRVVDFLKHTKYKYSFLESLDDEIPLALSHPRAMTYRYHPFKSIRKKLAKVIFNLINHRIFYCGLQQRIAWENTLEKSTGCSNSIDHHGLRTSTLFLSEDISCKSELIRVLLNEMCHAAAFIYHCEIGDGQFCRQWAYRAKTLMPELPILPECVPKYKYTCALCLKSSFGNTRFAEDSYELRCGFCQFELIVTKYNPDVHTLFLQHLKPTAYKAFIKSHYMKVRGSTHSAKMNQLNDLYLTKKLTSRSSC